MHPKSSLPSAKSEQDLSATRALLKWLASAPVTTIAAKCRQHVDTPGDKRTSEVLPPQKPMRPPSPQSRLEQETWWALKPVP
eukprot:CAMPEP_0115408514 /NCGR_PEP_ID=MMETSP0271-20121206/19526_1 /TAXON_ID=71861 /ORGANISM="Scrippsiella trochoidea, Strain CCMP3099" /LENGTH=81 /DNA_ID=CAMNT_0002832629 /DNA_START=380 /DNA_END=625 /DNA_ORIENTATION=-